jgi:hypothetical protein
MWKEFVSIFIVIVLAILNSIVFEWFTFTNGLDGRLSFTLILILTVTIQLYFESIKDKTASLLNKISTILINLVMISALVVSISMTVQNELYNSFAYLYSGLELLAPILLIIFNIRYIKRLNRSIMFRIIKLSFMIILVKIIEAIILYLFVFLKFDSNNLFNLFISVFSILFCYCIFLYKTKLTTINEDEFILIKNITLSFVAFFITLPYIVYSGFLMVLTFV